MEQAWIFSFAAMAMSAVALIVAVRTAALKTPGREIGQKVARRLDELEAAVVELSDSLKRVRSKYVMRERRTTATEDEPDWRTDPEAWRKHWDRKLTQRRLI